MTTGGGASDAWGVPTIPRYSELDLDRSILLRGGNLLQSESRLELVDGRARVSRRGDGGFGDDLSSGTTAVSLGVITPPAGGGRLVRTGRVGAK